MYRDGGKALAKTAKKAVSKGLDKFEGKLKAVDAYKTARNKKMIIEGFGSEANYRKTLR